MLFSLPALGIEQHVVQDKNLREALTQTAQPLWFVCGDEKVSLKYGSFEKHFYMGPENNGAVVGGFSGEDLQSWKTTLSKKELNEKILAVATKARLGFLKKGEKSLTVFETQARPRVDIKDAYVDCLKNGPTGWSFNPHYKREEMCLEGVSKFYGFEVAWADPKDEKTIWRFRYHGNIGGSTLSTNKPKEPVRYCITWGTTTILPTPME